MQGQEPAYLIVVDIVFLRIYLLKLNHQLMQFSSFLLLGLISGYTDRELFIVHIHTRKMKQND